MITTKEILERLKNGEDAEAIANELVSTLNIALEQHKAEEEEAKRKAEEQKAAAAKQKAKVEDMQEILDLLHDFCIDYYCNGNEDIDAVEAAFADLTAEKVIIMVEEAGAAALELEEQLKNFNHMLTKSPLFKSEEPKIIKVNKSDADAVINSFLKSIGL